MPAASLGSTHRGPHIQGQFLHNGGLGVFTLDLTHTPKPLSFEYESASQHSDIPMAAKDIGCLC